jgi:integrative and conjugative element protein (TIGR02256 family)
MQSRCWLDDSALRSLHLETGHWRVRETGGALLGWRSGSDAVIKRVLGPGPNAKHGFTFFEPDGEWQVVQGRRVFKESKKTIRYIGEWHSHPLARPIPSEQDRKTARQIAEDPDFMAPQPLSAIIGTSWHRRLRGADLDLKVYVWVDEQLQEMEIIRFDAPPVPPMWEPSDPR